MKKYVYLLIASVINGVSFSVLAYLEKKRTFNNSIQFTDAPTSTIMTNDMLQMAPWIIAGIVFTVCLYRIPISLGVPVFFLFMAGICFMACTTLTLPLRHNGVVVEGMVWRLPMDLVAIHLFLMAGTFSAYFLQQKK